MIKKVGAAFAAALLLLFVPAPAHSAPKPKIPASEAALPPAGHPPTGGVPKIGTKATAGNPAKAGHGAIPKRDPGAKDGGVTARNCCGGPWYYYQTGLQNFSSGFPTTLQANTKVFAPYVDTDDYHSLTELAAIKTISSARNIVEIGITVDPVVNGDYDPHLFGFWWKAGNGQCYNTGCGFTPYTSTPTNPITLGMTLTYGATVTYGILWDAPSTAWWLYASVSNIDSGTSHWVGYYDNTLWDTTNTYGSAVSGFVNMDNPQAFNEVAAGNIDGSGNAFKPCTDSGGIMPDMWSQPSDTHYISSVRYQTGLALPNLTWALHNPAVFPSFAGYGIYVLSAQSAYLGGEAADANGNLPGNYGWC